jgi:Transposase DDE domain
MTLSETGLERNWKRLLRRFGPPAALEESAKRCGALKRRREISRAEDLLRLSLAYGPCGMSLRTAAAWATMADIAKISDVAVLKRLRACGDWLEELVGLLLSQRLRKLRFGLGRVIRLYDATTVSHPGSDRADWRLHATYDPRAGQLSDVKLTTVKGGESLTRARVSAGEIWVADRGLAKGPGLAHVRRHGADFVVRISWNSLALRDQAGEQYDLAARLEAMGDAPSRQFRAVVVTGKGQTMPIRLLVRRKSPEEEAHEIKRLREKAARRGRTRRSGQPDRRSLLAARYIILATSLEAPPRQLFELYRLRWQIELAFKRLKSLLHFDQLQAKQPELARTWLLAHLIAALLIDDHTAEVLDTPPSALGIAA